VNLQPCRRIPFAASGPGAEARGTVYHTFNLAAGEAPATRAGGMMGRGTSGRVFGVRVARGAKMSSGSGVNIDLPMFREAGGDRLGMKACVHNKAGFLPWNCAAFQPLPVL